jgi:hypothetical protein
MFVFHLGHVRQITPNFDHGNTQPSLTQRLMLTIRCGVCYCNRDLAQACLSHNSNMATGGVALPRYGL